MKKFKRYVEKLKIRQQVFAAMVVVSIFSAVILGVVAYSLSKSVIERNYEAAYSYNLQVSSKILDMQAKTMVDSARSILVNDTIMDIMEEGNATGRDTFTASQMLTLTTALSELAGESQLIEGITLVNNNGQACFYYKRTKSGEFAHYTAEALLASDWLGELGQTFGREVFYGYDPLLPAQAGYVSMAKRLYNINSGEAVGYAVYSLRSEIFNKSFGKQDATYATAVSMVVDHETGKIIYYRGDTSLQEDIEHAWQHPDGRRFLLTEQSNLATGWSLVNVVTREDLSRDSLYIGGFIFAAILLLLIISSRVSKWISYRIYRPLGELSEAIAEAGEGSRNITQEFDSSEVGEIGKQFKTMVNTNLELREQLLEATLNEREAELLLLHAQINPHFLYNTLDALYCMAIIDNNMKTATMVSALSNMFKLSLNKGDKLIRVRDAIAHITDYMTIQNIRYNDRVDLQLDIDEEMQDAYIIQFLLQPFVENAMYHGIEPKIGKGYIRVTGRQRDGMLYFTIEDNGVGIDDLDRLKDGYGVGNVRERIQLFYGDEGSLRFESKWGVGTTVTISVPLRTREQWEEKGHEASGSD